MRLVCLCLFLSLIAAGASPAGAAPPGGWTPVDSVIAVVNQDVVLKSDFDRQLAGFKKALDAVKDPAERTKRRLELRRQVLRGLVDQQLFMQAAIALGLTATTQEIDRAIAEVKQQNKLDDAGLSKALADAGLTVVEYRFEIQRQILQAKVSTLILRPRIRVTDEELRAAYAEAQKRDPQRIGSFEEVKEPLAERVFEAAMQREQQRWLAERRAEAYIDLRIEP
jgi:parvulin-like peptidyl-prolyl isomerase